MRVKKKMTNAVILRWECKTCNAQATGVHVPVACSTCGSAPSNFTMVSDKPLTRDDLSLSDLHKMAEEGLGAVEL